MDTRKLIEKASGRFADKPALIFKGEAITFARLRDQTLRLASVLKSNCSVNKGDKIAIYLPNCPQYVYSYLACFCLVGVGVPLDFMLTTDELISCLSHSQAKVLITKIKNDIAL